MHYAIGAWVELQPDRLAPDVTLSVYVGKSPSKSLLKSLCLDYVYFVLLKLLLDAVALLGAVFTALLRADIMFVFVMTSNSKP